jgi:hypothetical protein
LWPSEGKEDVPGLNGARIGTYSRAGQKFLIKILDHFMTKFN